METYHIPYQLLLHFLDSCQGGISGLTEIFGVRYLYYYNHNYIQYILIDHVDNKPAFLNVRVKTWKNQ